MGQNALLRDRDGELGMATGQECGGLSLTHHARIFHLRLHLFPVYVGDGLGQDRPGNLSC